MSKENPNELKIINKNERLKYQKLLYKYKQQISDLEAKLAEMTKKYELASCPTGGLVDRVRNLELQLAEKEKKNKKLTLLYFGDENTETILTTNKMIQHIKISFAVEQLEKVKEFVSRQLFITTKDCNDLDEAEAKGCNELREETIKEIDNQINDLKGEEV